MLLIVSAAPLASSVAAIPVELDISAPLFAPVGAPTAITGSYHLKVREDPPLLAEQVEVFVDGVSAGVDTNVLGAYSVSHVFPARGIYQVHAVANDGELTEATSVTLTVKGAEPPTVAQNVLVRPVAGSVRIQVSWTPPVDNGGAPITGYEIWRRDSPTATWKIQGTVGGSSSAFEHFVTMSGAPNYVYRVMAKNAVGLSPPVEAVLSGDPLLPPIVTATPVHMSDRVNVVAVSGGGPTQQIQLERRYGNGPWQTIRDAAGASLSHTDVVWLGFFPEYRAAARSMVGNSAPSEGVFVTGAAPGAPTGVDVAVSDHLEITWEAPADGGAVQGYRVYHNGQWLDSYGPERTSTLWWGDIGAGTHEFTVLATNAASWGPASAPAVVTLALASAPALTGATIEETRTGRVELSWTASVDDGGAPIVGYGIWRTPGGYNWDGSPQGRASVGWVEPGEPLSFVATGLREGETYTFEVAAYTVAGPGVVSTYIASVPNIDWLLDHDLTHFVACEGTACTNVPANGVYDRVGTGAVTYRAVYAGSLTRNGVPWQGENVLVTTWEESDPEQENAQSDLVTTNASGQYTMQWTRPTSITPSSCTQLGFDSRASTGVSNVGASLARFTICP